MSGGQVFVWSDKRVWISTREHPQWRLTNATAFTIHTSGWLLLGLDKAPGDGGLTIAAYPPGEVIEIRPDVQEAWPEGRPEERPVS